MAVISSGLDSDMCGFISQPHPIFSDALLTLSYVLVLGSIYHNSVIVYGRDIVVYSYNIFIFCYKSLQNNA